MVYFQQSRWASIAIVTAFLASQSSAWEVLGFGIGRITCRLNNNENPTYTEGGDAGKTSECIDYGFPETVLMNITGWEPDCDLELFGDMNCQDKRRTYRHDEQAAEKDGKLLNWGCVRHYDYSDENPTRVGMKYVCGDDRED